MCKFSDKIAQEYPDIPRSKQGDDHALCKVCKVDISIGNGGKSDVKQHVGKAKHKKQKQAAQDSNKINQHMRTMRSYRTEHNFEYNRLKNMWFPVELFG